MYNRFFTHTERKIYTSVSLGPVKEEGGVPAASGGRVEYSLGNEAKGCWIVIPKRVSPLVEAFVFDDRVEYRGLHRFAKTFFISFRLDRQQLVIEKNHDPSRTHRYLKYYEMLCQELNIEMCLPLADSAMTVNTGRVIFGLRVFLTRCSHRFRFISQADDDCLIAT